MSDFKVTSNYGWRTHPISGKRKFHSGIDLVKKHKAPIYAFTGGKVIHAKYAQSGTGLGGYGNSVVIEDVQGRAHLYAHLDTISVHKGQRVNEGDKIGRQGKTGRVTGSHLHYEVRKKSSPSFGWSRNPANTTIKPMQFVKKSGGKRMVRKIKTDGYLGKDTIKRMQQFFGTPMDGKLSKPSLVIKNLQKFLNQVNYSDITIDGYLGENTIKELQKMLNTPVDGKLSKPSLVIKEWQRFLNSYGQ